MYTNILNNDSKFYLACNEESDKIWAISEFYTEPCTHLLYIYKKNKSAFSCLQCYEIKRRTCILKNERVHNIKCCKNDPFFNRLNYRSTHQSLIVLHMFIQYIIFDIHHHGYNTCKTDSM